MDVLHAGVRVRPFGLHDRASWREPARRAGDAHPATISRLSIDDDYRDPDVSRGAAGRGPAVGPWSLTQRELEVLQLLAEGATNGEISQRLYISPKTTKNHLAAIFQKLDVTNRTHALVRAVVMGLVTIE